MASKAGSVFVVLTMDKEVLAWGETILSCNYRLRSKNIMIGGDSGDYVFRKRNKKRRTNRIFGLKRLVLYQFMRFPGGGISITPFLNNGYFEPKPGHKDAVREWLIKKGYIS